MIISFWFVSGIMELSQAGIHDKLNSDIIENPAGNPELLLRAFEVVISGGTGPFAVTELVDGAGHDPVILQVDADIEFGASSFPEILQLACDTEHVHKFPIIEEAAAIDDVYRRIGFRAVSVGTSGEGCLGDGAADVFCCEVLFR
jgi:hypothetical protein